MRSSLSVLLLATLFLATAASTGLAAPDSSASPPVALVCLPARPSQDVLESAVLQELLRLRSAAGLGRTELPVMLYTFDRAEEQEYCRFRLHLRLGYAPCIALVACRTVRGAAVPDAVIDHVSQVRDWRSACSQMMAECLKRRKGNPAVGLLVVWDHAHPPVAGALEQARRAARGDAALRRIARKAVAMIGTSGTSSPPVRVMHGGDLPELYARWGVVPGRLPLAGVATLDARGNPVDLRTAINNVDHLPEDDVARRLVEAWKATCGP